MKENVGASGLDSYSRELELMREALRDCETASFPNGAEAHGLTDRERPTALCLEPGGS